MNDRYRVEFETHYKHIAIEFIKEVSQSSDVRYYLFEKVKEETVEIPSEVKELAEQRLQAKAEKNSHTKLEQYLDKKNNFGHI